MERNPLGKRVLLCTAGNDLEPVLRSYEWITIVKKVVTYAGSLEAIQHYATSVDIVILDEWLESSMPEGIDRGDGQRTKELVNLCNRVRENSDTARIIVITKPRIPGDPLLSELVGGLHIYDVVHDTVEGQEFERILQKGKTYSEIKYLLTTVKSNSAEKHVEEILEEPNKGMGQDEPLVNEVESEVTNGLATESSVGVERIRRKKPAIPKELYVIDQIVQKQRIIAFAGLRRSWVTTHALHTGALVSHLYGVKTTVIESNNVPVYAKKYYLDHPELNLEKALGSPLTSVGDYLLSPITVVWKNKELLEAQRYAEKALREYPPGFSVLAAPLQPTSRYYEKLASTVPAIPQSLCGADKADFVVCDLSGASPELLKEMVYRCHSFYVLLEADESQLPSWYEYMERAGILSRARDIGYTSVHKNVSLVATKYEEWQYDFYDKYSRQLGMKWYQGISNDEEVFKCAFRGGICLDEFTLHCLKKLISDAFPRKEKVRRPGLLSRILPRPIKAGADEQEIKDSLTDELTGLRNKRYYEEHISKIVERKLGNKQQVGIIGLDINDFKQVNDRGSHSIGDTAIQEVANCLSSCLREGDIAIRKGGDEYCVVLFDLPGDYSDAIKYTAMVAERMRLSVAATTIPGWGSVTISLGVAVGPTDGETLGQIFDAADRREIRAKKMGKNIVVYSDTGDVFTFPEPEVAATMMAGHPHPTRMELGSEPALPIGNATPLRSEYDSGRTGWKRHRKRRKLSKKYGLVWNRMTDVIILVGLLYVIGIFIMAYIHMNNPKISLSIFKYPVQLLDHWLKLAK